MLIKLISIHFLMTFVIQKALKTLEFIYFEEIFQIMQPFFSMLCLKNVLSL
jgi:hypothetical protein